MSHALVRIGSSGTVDELDSKVEIELWKSFEAEERLANINEARNCLFRARIF